MRENFKKKNNELLLVSSQRYQDLRYIFFKILNLDYKKGLSNTPITANNF